MFECTHCFWSDGQSTSSVVGRFLGRTRIWRYRPHRYGERAGEGSSRAATTRRGYHGDDGRYDDGMIVYCVFVHSNYGFIGLNTMTIITPLLSEQIQKGTMTEKVNRSMAFQGAPSLSTEDTTRSGTRQKTKRSFTKRSVDETDEEQKQTDEVIDTKPGKGLSLLKKLQSKKKGKKTVAAQRAGSTNGKAGGSEIEADALSSNIDLEAGYLSDSATAQPLEVALSPSTASNSRYKGYGSGSLTPQSATGTTGRTLSRCFAERIWTEGYYDVIHVEYLHLQREKLRLLSKRLLD